MPFDKHYSNSLGGSIHSKMIKLLVIAAFVALAASGSFNSITPLKRNVPQV